MTSAVNLGGAMELSLEKKVTKPVAEAELSPFRNNIQRYIDQRQSDASDEDKKDWSVYDVARQKLAAYPADVTIEIPRNACRTLEFDRAAEMIDLGRSKARSCLARQTRADPE